MAAIKQEALETEQTFARVGLYADTRIGELLKELPTRQGKRTDTSSTAIEEVTKAQALEESGISTPAAYQLEQLAANPDVVQAVLDKAEAYRLNSGDCSHRSYKARSKASEGATAIWIEEG